MSAEHTHPPDRPRSVPVRICGWASSHGSWAGPTACTSRCRRARRCRCSRRTGCPCLRTPVGCFRAARLGKEKHKLRLRTGCPNAFPRQHRVSEKLENVCLTAFRRQREPPTSACYRVPQRKVWRPGTGSVRELTVWCVASTQHWLRNPWNALRSNTEWGASAHPHRWRQCECAAKPRKRGVTSALVKTQWGSGRRGKRAPLFLPGVQSLHFKWWLWLSASSPDKKKHRQPAETSVLFFCSCHHTRMRTHVVTRVFSPSPMANTLEVVLLYYFHGIFFNQASNWYSVQVNSTGSGASES